ncbi:MAG: hypothetical protein V1916_03645 [Patescibacteria group bacterium]
MDDPNVSDGGFLSGFLVKGKNGQLKKVQDGVILDYQPATPSSAAATPPPPPPAVKPAVKPAAAKTLPVALVVPPPPPLPQTLQPQPPVSSSARAPLFIAPEDEEEIKQHRAELAQKIGPATPPAVDPAAVVCTLQQDFNLQFADEVLAKRFAKVVESRLHSARSDIETAEVLSRPSKIGGLGLQPPVAQAVVQKIVALHAPQPKPAGRVAPPVAPKPIPLTVAVPVPPAFVPLPKPRPPAPPASPAVKVVPIGTPAPVPPPTPKPAPPAASPVQPAQPVSDLYGMSQAEAMSKISRSRQAEVERPQVVDIRQPNRVLGPVEELRDIDLKEFRRLGVSPQEAADRVVEKVALLEEESWQMRMDGLRAWQRSPVFRLYAAIGRQSIERGRTVAAIIQELHAAGQPYLLPEEFTAMVTLNTRISI